MNWPMFSSFLLRESSMSYLLCVSVSKVHSLLIHILYHYCRLLSDIIIFLLSYRFSLSHFPFSLLLVTTSLIFLIWSTTIFFRGKILILSRGNNFRMIQYTFFPSRKENTASWERHFKYTTWCSKHFLYCFSCELYFITRYSFASTYISPLNMFLVLYVFGSR